MANPQRDTITGYDFEIDAPLTPIKAMRNFCLLCCNGSVTEVKECPIRDCFLWPYRTGRRPKIVEEKAPMSEERKEQLNAALHKARLVRSRK